jgi:DNA-binding NtrC family response regulator
MTRTPSRVLIIDPHEDVLIVLEKLLEDAGFATQTAWCGAEALTQIRRKRFDVVLVSDYLPDCGCETIVKELDRKSRRACCFVMQPCAPSMAEDRFLHLGASGVVCKHDLAAIKRMVMETVRERTKSRILRVAG